METLSACPACAGRDLAAVTDGGLDFAGERVQACRDCGLFFLSPRLDAAELAAYYAGEYSARYRGGERPDAAALARRDRIARYRFARLREAGVLAPGATLLELGCSAGSFLALCRDLGLSVWGVEPSRGYAEVARERGLAVEIAGFPTARGPLAAYDVVALFHVLEHLPDPPGTLAALRGLLAPGGRLAIEVPDLARSFSWRWSARYFSRPHLVDFTAGSLARLLGRCGFTVDLVDYPSAEPRRRHHLLVVARPDGRSDEGVAAVAPPPAAAAETDRLVARVRRRARWAELARPVWERARRLLRPP